MCLNKDDGKEVVAFVFLFSLFLLSLCVTYIKIIGIQFGLPQVYD